MKVLLHHIYEYKKGIRDLVLHTMNSKYRLAATSRLEQNNIAYLVRNVSENKINIFFGNENCIEVLKTFGNKSLTQFSPEEDFMLGIMLGYSRSQQYQRFLSQYKKQHQKALLTV